VLGTGQPYAGGGSLRPDIVLVMEQHSSEGYESLPERLIREAIEAGEFDDLPGSGLPLPGAGVPDDELWWVRSWLRRKEAEVGVSTWNSG
jgi:Domain of unknown function (DUF1992)